MTKHTHLIARRASPMRRAIVRTLALSLTVVGASTIFLGCGSGGDSVAATPAPPTSGPTPPPPPAPVPPPPPPASIGPPQIKNFAQGLSAPWGMAFLPDARIIVTEKSGSVRVVSADGKTVSAPLTGMPAVASAGQGGLLDVAIDPDFASVPFVYFSLSEADPANGSKTGTAVFKARLQGNALTEGSVIFRMNEKVVSGGHFGSRIVFAKDKTMYITLGDRQSANERGKAQLLDKHHGKVVRINRDGTIPANNPYAAATASNVQRDIWSFGHRNPQGAAIHPTTGDLWVSEHGPQGGDEINIARAGRNYGWPEISWGCEYGTSPADACVWAGGTARANMEQPLTYWKPLSIAPSNIAFYTGDKFSEWKGNLFVGAMSSNAGGQRLWRLTLSGDSVASREELFASANERIRDVKQGPDGWIYLLTDSGRILRIER